MFTFEKGIWIKRSQQDVFKIEVNVEQVGYMGEIHDAVTLAPVLQQVEAPAF